MDLKTLQVRTGIEEDGSVKFLVSMMFMPVIQIPGTQPKELHMAIYRDTPAGNVADALEQMAAYIRGDVVNNVKIVEADTIES